MLVSQERVILVGCLVHSYTPRQSGHPPLILQRQRYKISEVYHFMKTTMCYAEGRKGIKNLTDPNKRNGNEEEKNVYEKKIEWKKNRLHVPSLHVQKVLQ